MQAGLHLLACKLVLSPGWHLAMAVSSVSDAVSHQPRVELLQSQVGGGGGDPGGGGGKKKISGPVSGAHDCGFFRWHLECLSGNL